MHAKLAQHFYSVSSIVPTKQSNISMHHWNTVPTPLATLNDWLFDQGSLTQRLKQLCTDAFTVQLLCEGWQTLSADECQALNVTGNSCGWVREVFLCDGQQPWVFARSVASQAELESSGFNISQLGTRSLGELLFSQQAFKRGVMHIRQLPCQQLPSIAQQHTSNQTHVWARRSCFKKDTLGVLVAEIFLPQLWQDTDNSTLNTV